VARRRSGWHSFRLRLSRDDDATGEAVRATAACARQSGDGLSGRAARCPDSGFMPRSRRGAWQPRGNGTLPHGPGAARGF
jgi:hypothetical protein